MYHDVCFTAAADKSMSLFMVLGVAAVVVVLVHAINHFDVATLEPHAEQAASGLVHQFKELSIGADIGPAVGIEGKFVPSPDEFVRQVQGPRLANDERVILQHNG